MARRPNKQNAAAPSPPVVKSREDRPAVPSVAARPSPSPAAARPSAPPGPGRIVPAGAVRVPARAPTNTPLVLFGGFALLSVVFLMLAWPGYQIRRHTDLALRAIGAGRHAVAIPHLEFVLRKFPKATDRLVQLGDCMLETERPADALRAYEQALKDDAAARAERRAGDEEKPLDLDARRGRAEFMLGNHADSIRLLKGVVERDPHDPEANYYIGLHYMLQKNHAKAAFFFQAAGADPILFEKSKPQLEEIRRTLLGG